MSQSNDPANLPSMNCTLPRWALAAAIGLGLTITGFVAFGFVAGGGWAEVQTLAALPWGLTTFVDVYVGLLLFSGWVVFRERAMTPKIVWVALVLLGGNALACLYVVWAWRQSRGHAARFWLGDRSERLAD